MQEKVLEKLLVSGRKGTAGLLSWPHSCPLVPVGIVTVPHLFGQELISCSFMAKIGAHTGVPWPWLGAQMKTQESDGNQGLTSCRKPGHQLVLPSHTLPLPLEGGQSVGSGWALQHLAEWGRIPSIIGCHLHE